MPLRVCGNATATLRRMRSKSFRHGRREVRRDELRIGRSPRSLDPQGAKKKKPKVLAPVFVMEDGLSAARSRQSQTHNSQACEGTQAYELIRKYAAD